MKSLLLLLVIFPLLAHADERDAAPGELLSRYWLEEPLTLSLSFGVPNHLFSFTPPGGENDRQKIVDYSPPQATDLNLLVGYGIFAASWKQPLPQGSSSKRTYGKSTYDDFALEAARGRYAASLYLQTFRGFYTDLNGSTGNYARFGSASGNEPQKLEPQAIKGPQDIEKRPDIQSRHYGAIGWYAWPLIGESADAFQLNFQSLPGKPDPGFSLDLVNSVFYDRAEIRGASPLVPKKKAEAFGRTASLQSVDMHSAGVGIGTALSYAFYESGFQLDGLMLYGGGLQRQHLEFVDDNRWSTAYVNNFNMKFGVNYRTDAQQAGLHFWVNTMGSKVGDVRFSSSNMAIELGYLHRI